MILFRDDEKNYQRMDGVMKNKNFNKVCSVVVLGVLSAGNILFVHSDVWNVKAGEQLDMTAWNASAYQVESVSQLKDGGYIVNSKAAGFKSDLEVAVTFDAAGEVIQQVAVISQDETEGIGTKVMDDSFLGQFPGQTAPLGLRGKEQAVISPGTGEVWGAASVPDAGTSEAVQTEQRSNPERWNPEDQSPEAQAVRNLYRAGLLSSAMENQPLQTALADASPEEQAAYRLEEEGLTTSTDHDHSPSRAQSPEEVAADKLQQANLTTNAETDASPSRAQSPEGVAADKLEQAGLTVRAETDTPVQEAAVVSGDLSEVDAVAGATISSAAVIQAVDQAYFFMQEQVLGQ